MSWRLSSRRRHSRGKRSGETEHGYRVLFTTAAAIITTLARAVVEGHLEEKLKLHAQPRLLIIDEVGYLPIDQTGANLFFQLISRRIRSFHVAGVEPHVVGRSMDGRTRAGRAEILLGDCPGAGVGFSSVGQR